MLATAWSAALLGLDAAPVRVEVEVRLGVPHFELVGLAEATVREARVRVRSALAQLGVLLGEYSVVVNLAPAELRKVGSGFDLAIALGVLVAVGRLPPAVLEGTLWLGELSLSGELQPVRGVLPRLLSAKRMQFARAVVPAANAQEAEWVEGLSVGLADSLGQLAHGLAAGLPLPEPVRRTERGAPPRIEADLADVRGQAAARRALEIAAAGRHNLLMIGPPGAGKTMLARRLPGLLPALQADEVLETMAIASIAGALGAEVAPVRPFRAPHHTVSEFALVGGGEPPRPGEVSLAHRGVLFLDELPEFRRSALEALRQPLEDGEVTVSRAHSRATFPAVPLLVAAMNPCPCGHLGDASRCRCSEERVRSYRGRLSGPLLDRLDLHVVLPPVALRALREGEPGESSEVVRARVERASCVQRARHAAGTTRAFCNATLSVADAQRVCELDAAAERLLLTATERMGLSARAFGKVLRVARTIADLGGAARIGCEHVAEAVALRVIDRGRPQLQRASLPASLR